MTVLLMRLSGPLQSWGVESHQFVRETMPRPTKSGVVGLLANALGRSRQDPVSDLAALPFGVRIERAGVQIVDYHTLEMVTGRTATTTKVTYRHYLADAAFLAAVEGDDGLIAELAAALASPARPLSLGRRSCVPDLPIMVGTTAQTLDEVLTGYPPVVDQHDQYRTWFRDADAAEPGGYLPDYPLAFNTDHRRFAPRKVTSGAVTDPADPFDSIQE